MKRPGNILIMTLIACAMLALVLTAGVQLASLKTASQAAQLENLQLEQLHRTAVADTLEALNASGEKVSSGRVVLSDTPLSGQKRQVTVQASEGDLLTLESESRLANGGRRLHHIQVLALPLEERFGFAKERRALYHSVGHDVPDRWLTEHQDADLVVLCDKRPTRRYRIGDGDALLALSGSLYVRALSAGDFEAWLETPLSLGGHAVFGGDLRLESDLSCKEAWIDGTLTIGEGMRLQAETVTLGEDIPAETLARIEAATIYMPHPPDEAEDAAEETVIRPLPDEEGPTPSDTAYLMLQQLD